MPTPLLPFAATRSRRAIAAAIAGLPIVGAIRRGGADNAAAKKRKRKKITLCLNGQTINASKKQKKKLLKQGATAGKCAPTPAPPTCACASSQRCCGATCVTPRWDNQTTAGSGPGSAADQLKFPTGCAISSDTRTLAIGDTDNSRVSVWARSGAASLDWSAQTVFGASAGSGDDQFQNPTGLAFSADGRALWIADTDNNRVSVWTRSSATSTDWANHATFGSGPGNSNSQFDHPNDVAISPDTLTAFVADTGNSRVTIWTRPDVSSDIWSYDAKFGSGPGAGALEFNQPFGLAVSPDTLTIWVSDTNNSRVSVWTRADASSPMWSRTATISSGPGDGPNQIAYPRSLAVAADTLAVWVSDTNNNRVSVWTRPTATSTAWNTLRTFGEAGNGPGQFGGPQAIALAPDAATVWVTDFINSRVSLWAATCPA